MTANASTGNDIAILYDSQSDDSFVANPTTARLFGAGYSNRANGFDQVHANAFGGNDTATLDAQAATMFSTATVPTRSFWPPGSSICGRTSSS